MSNYCVSCGTPVPEGQRNCSMCYGDPAHGRDGYCDEFIRREQERLRINHEHEPEEYWPDEDR